MGPTVNPMPRMAAKVSSDPVAVVEERFVQTDAGEMALHTVSRPHMPGPNPTRRLVIEM
ncbi:hypothetical protein GCM10017778_45610 [Streptomyces vinaceus]|nr:hypothetical protein GCM10017778_45610 [Streptomyces vinaceus]